MAAKIIPSWVKGMTRRVDDAASAADRAALAAALADLMAHTLPALLGSAGQVQADEIVSALAGVAAIHGAPK